MKTLKPLSCSRQIAFGADALQTEFELQAELFVALRNHGVNVRGEVPWLDRSTREHCRFDLVVYKDGVPFHIIEVKARQVKHRTCVEDTRQGKRYREFGIPVTFLYGPLDIDDLFNGGFVSDVLGFT